MLNGSFSILTSQGGNSRGSGLDPRFKLGAAVIVGVEVLLARNAAQFLAIAALVLVCATAARVPPSLLWSAEKPVLLFTVVGGGLIAFETPGKGWSLSFAHVSAAGLELGGRLAVQLLLLVAITTVLTYTTTPLAIANALRRLLGFLRHVRVPVEDMTTMLTIAITFLPLMTREVDRYLTARAARGANSSRLGVWSMLGDMLVPLMQTNLQRGEELALALDARLYGFGNRTYWHDQERPNLASFVLVCAVTVVGVVTIAFL